MFRFVACAAILLIAACSADLSPREQDQQLMTGYLVPQTAAAGAVHSPLLADKPDVVHAIRTTTDATSAAILAYDVEARKCVRDQATGNIVNAPGAVCDQSWLSRSLTAALASIANLGDMVKSYGF